MKNTAVLAIIFLIAFAANFAGASSDIYIEWGKPDNAGPLGETPETRALSDSLFKWAWEIPESITEKYPTMEYSYFLPVSSPFGGGLRLLYFRTLSAQEDLLFSGYFFFRPVVLDFSEVYLSLGAYFAFDTSWSEGRNAYDPFFNTDALYKSEGGAVTGGFSMVLSIPKIGIQMTGEIGHFWSRVKLRYVDLLLAGPPPTADGEFFGIQKETGLDMFYNFTIASERSYLAAISFSVLASYRSGPVEVSAKEIYPPSAEIDVPPFHSDFVLGLVYLKALSVPARQKFVDLPVSQYDFITVEPVAGVGHFVAGHGYVLSAGVRVSIFDSIAFTYLHNWEQRNDADNSNAYLLEFGIQLGRRLGIR